MDHLAEERNHLVRRKRIICWEKRDRLAEEDEASGWKYLGLADPLVGDDLLVRLTNHLAETYLRFTDLLVDRKNRVSEEYKSSCWRKCIIRLK